MKWEGRGLGAPLTRSTIPNRIVVAAALFGHIFYHAANKNKQHMRKKPQITSEPNTRSVFIKKHTQPHLC